jgi:hypothetical protein
MADGGVSIARLQAYVILEAHGHGVHAPSDHSPGFCPASCNCGKRGPNDYNGGFLDVSALD